MPITKPASLPRWEQTVAGGQGTSGGLEVEPASGKKDIGWLVGEKPPAQYMNWWQRLVYDWIQWIDRKTSAGHIRLSSGVGGEGDANIVLTVDAADHKLTPLAHAFSFGGVTTTGGTFDGVTVADAGKYRVLASVTFLNILSVSETFHLLLRKNGVAWRQLSEINIEAAGAGETSSSMCACGEIMDNLAANDLIEIWYMVNNGGGPTGNAYCTQAQLNVQRLD